MQIFNHKTVVGLFDHDQAIEQAVGQLQKSGFDQEDDDALQIIDQHRLAQESPIEGSGRSIMPQPRHSSPVGGTAAPFNLITEAGTEASNIERSTYHALTDRGVGQEEAWFYARQVARGSSLVIIEATKERAAQAAGIMNQAGAKTLES